MTAYQIHEKLQAIGGDSALLTHAEYEMLMHVLRTWDDMLLALQLTAAEVRAAIAKAAQ